jgi:Bacterial Ig-like domain (group 3)/FG-GAP-like repeat/Abnormal spindle-like microcephaly-assoc'd, ASPM-SPD-2-Hydin
VQLGNGDGTFKKAMINPAHKDPISIVTADFNHDGNLDLVTANWNSFDISVLLGNGDGTFKARVNYPIAATYTTASLATGDFNGDGNPDLAVANGSIGISLGNGDGTFQPQITYSAHFAFSVAVADINRDGKLDLVVTGSDATINVLLGNGDGTFQPAISSPGGQPVIGSLADVNGDGLLDLVTVPWSTYPSAPIAVQLGNGDGTFQAPVFYGAGDGPISATVGDFNGDGAPDLAIGSLAGVTINLNTGGTFLATTNAPNPSTLQQNVTFTTTVAASLKGQPLPSGKVTFTDGTNTLGSATLSNGQAIFTTSFSTSGQHQITPVYSGDNNFNPHAGATVVQTVQAPTVNLSPTSLNFGSQKVGTTSAPMTAKLTNRGAGTLLISSISLSGSSDFLPIVDNCLPSVGPKKSCTFTLTFSPSGTGTRKATITITDNATSSPQKLTLTGTGD